MPDILVVKSTAFLPHEKMQAILDNLKEQKETGVILLPPYLEAFLYGRMKGEKNGVIE